MIGPCGNPFGLDVRAKVEVLREKISGLEDPGEHPGDDEIDPGQRGLGVVGEAGAVEVKGAGHDFEFYARAVDQVIDQAGRFCFCARAEVREVALFLRAEAQRHSFFPVGHVRWSPFG